MSLNDSILPVVRIESIADYREVEEVTREAFWNQFQEGADEHYLLHQMRGHADFIPELSLVAVLDDKIVGHIAYTHSKILARISSSDEELESKQPVVLVKTITFGPISVLPSYQSKGIGRLLIMQSLQKAKDLGFRAVVIYGHPTYYGKLGFRCAEKYDIVNPGGYFVPAMLTYELENGVLREVERLGGGVFHESSIFETFVSEDRHELVEYDATFAAKEKANTKSIQVFQVVSSLKYKCEV